MVIQPWRHGLSLGAKIDTFPLPSLGPFSLMYVREFEWWVLSLFFFFPEAGAILLSSCFCVRERGTKRKCLVSGINVFTKSALADS